MAHEDRTPDFDDLLAAFDIPEVPSISTNSKDQDAGLNQNGNVANRLETSNNTEKKCNKEEHLMPTSKLTLGATNKRNILPKQPVHKKAPVLSNRQIGKMQIVTSSAVPIPSLNTVSSPEPINDDTTYQLSTNVLPPYVPMMPPPDKFKLILPPEGYKCGECGDRFILESSLVQHSQRRSVYITFNCDTCKKMLIYYNRCNLLSHIRFHREKNQLADIRKADVVPLPRELMNNIQLPPSSLQTNGSVIVNSSPITTVIVNGSPRLTKVGVQYADGRFRCSECNQFFENATALEDHFGRSQNMPLATSQCAKCNMTCPSKCSLSAHQRIHLQSKPFICPECGQKVSDNWNAFQRHLSVKCLHYSRTIGYKCSICTVLYNEAELLRQHIISTHSEAYYKCQACPMAFKAGNTFDTHKKTAHLTMDVQCKMIFKCPLCDTVFHSSDQLHTHLDVHIKEQIRATKFVFKCLECYKLLEAKPLLAEHLKEVHPQVVIKEVCVLCGNIFDNKELLLEHKKEVHTSPHSDTENTRENQKVPTHQGLTKCEQCNRVFQTGHGYNIHKQRCHGNKNSALVCFVCNLQCTSRVEIALHGKQHQKEGLLVCIVCNNLTFESRNGLAKHLDTHASNMKFPTKCDCCDEYVQDIVSAAAHLKREHGFSSFRCSKCDATYYTSKSLMRHERVMHNPDGTRKKYVCWICKERDFGKRVLLEKHVVVAHKIAAEDIDYSQMLKSSRPPIKIKIPRPVYMAAVKQEEEAILTPHKKLKTSDQTGGYVCFKCDYACDVQSTFLDHIAIHKTERSSFQCHECGTCFVVAPSLRKHLLVVHKIKNLDHYFVDESISSGTNSDVETVGETNGKSLECSVCCNIFPNALSLKTHMRTHGMAFIRSKRFTNASENSPKSSK